MEQKRTALRVAIFNSGKKQIEIAKRAKIQEARLSRLANGHQQASPEEMKRIAKAIRRPIAEVFPEAVA